MGEPPPDDLQGLSDTCLTVAGVAWPLSDILGASIAPSGAGGVGAVEVARFAKVGRALLDGPVAPASGDALADRLSPILVSTPSALAVAVQASGVVLWGPVMSCAILRLVGSLKASWGLLKSCGVLWVSLGWLRAAAAAAGGAAALAAALGRRKLPRTAPSAKDALAAGARFCSPPGVLAPASRAAPAGGAESARAAAPCRGAAASRAAAKVVEAGRSAPGAACCPAAVASAGARDAPRRALRAGRREAFTAGRPPRGGQAGCQRGSQRLLRARSGWRRVVVAALVRVRSSALCVEPGVGPGVQGAYDAWRSPPSLSAPPAFAKLRALSARALARAAAVRCGSPCPFPGGPGSDSLSEVKKCLSNPCNQSLCQDCEWEQMCIQWLISKGGSYEYLELISLRLKYSQRASQHSGTFAKAGVDLHGRMEDDTSLWRGLRSLAMEAGRWAAQLDVAISAMPGRDAAGHAHFPSPAPSATPVLGTEPDGDFPGQPMAEDGRLRRGVGGAETAMGPFPGVPGFRAEASPCKDPATHTDSQVIELPEQNNKVLEHMSKLLEKQNEAIEVQNKTLEYIAEKAGGSALRHNNIKNAVLASALKTGGLEGIQYGGVFHGGGKRRGELLCAIFYKTRIEGGAEMFDGVDDQDTNVEKLFRMLSSFRAGLLDDTKTRDALLGDEADVMPEGAATTVVKQVLGEGKGQFESVAIMPEKAKDYFDAFKRFGLEGDASERICAAGAIVARRWQVSKVAHEHQKMFFDVHIKTSFPSYANINNECEEMKVEETSKQEFEKIETEDMAARLPSDWRGVSSEESLAPLENTRDIFEAIRQELGLAGPPENTQWPEEQEALEENAQLPSNEAESPRSREPETPEKPGGETEELERQELEDPETPEKLEVRERGPQAVSSSGEKKRGRDRDELETPEESEGEVGSPRSREPETPEKPESEADEHDDEDTERQELAPEEGKRLVEEPEVYVVFSSPDAGATEPASDAEECNRSKRAAGDVAKRTTVSKKPAQAPREPRPSVAEKPAQNSRKSKPTVVKIETELKIETAVQTDVKQQRADAETEVETELDPAQENAWRASPVRGKTAEQLQSGEPTQFQGDELQSTVLTRLKYELEWEKAQDEQMAWLETLENAKHILICVHSENPAHYTYLKVAKEHANVAIEYRDALKVPSDSAKQAATRIFHEFWVMRMSVPSFFDMDEMPEISTQLSLEAPKESENHDDPKNDERPLQDSKGSGGEKPLEDVMGQKRTRELEEIPSSSDNEEKRAYQKAKRRQSAPQPEGEEPEDDEPEGDSGKRPKLEPEPVVEALPERLQRKWALEDVQVLYLVVLCPGARDRLPLGESGRSVASLSSTRTAV
ncbi:unnamed protein product [Prorocentrum cordatum]|uniref:Uncharacterized protein n=1 Tax=Prorocentrum cordatum TaxID=2364126 RepID=A0ABN9W5I2_9DINO|nr:unnamed protein product [Polarella glacialis]